MDSTSKVIRAMLAYSKRTVAELANACNVSRQTIWKRLKTDSWTAKELLIAATICDFEVIVKSKTGNYVTLNADKDKDGE